MARAKQDPGNPVRFELTAVLAIEERRHMIPDDQDIGVWKVTRSDFPCQSLPCLVEKLEKAASHREIAGEPIIEVAAMGGLQRLAA